MLSVSHRPGPDGPSGVGGAAAPHTHPRTRRGTRTRGTPMPKRTRANMLTALVVAGLTAGSALAAGAVPAAAAKAPAAPLVLLDGGRDRGRRTRGAAVLPG